MDTFWFYFKEGLYHVLDWDAYDHILFLVVLTVPYLFSNWKKLLTLVTVFTIGHTVSLALSAYGIIAVNTSLVEVLIPITILITALYNIFTAGKKSRNSKINIHLFAALFFGLIHGLGFSTYFKMMTAGKESKLLPLLEYTLGIEAAQLIIVFIVLIISFVGQAIFRFSLRDWVMVISSIVIGVAIPVFRTALSSINF
ncbi:HupE/UreJ family protein [Dokdonia sp. Hel_I_53]|uniref:HupE/UreJ family protein n=1 Tax=Dokdonia sp. Hel_I_53 TaxID=1566287 RepID=UPI00119B8828|nr:HupE/UreJ family protein [Dokdonia sp. Hel_I_53]TVZ52477.1 HupE/UreJ protein [Dokdonia sp. Hel_I_53]